MIDFHSHILPKVDDGPQTVQDSVSLLKEFQRQGVTTVVSTSHCYAKNEEKISHFLSRRAQGYQALQEAMKQDGGEFPEIRLGSEVGLMTDLNKFENLSELCIEGTNYMLVEMPYKPWRPWMIESIYQLSTKGIRPIMAHIDRYYDQKQPLMQELFELDVLFQINASVVAGFASRHFLLPKLLKQHYAHLLGSDAHNLSTRPPMMYAAYKKLRRFHGNDWSLFFEENAKAVLENQELSSLQ